jgi:hypothetical protein
VLRFAICGTLLFGLAATATAQVRVTIPSQELTFRHKFPATVENASTEPVTFCVEFEQTSSNGIITERTPIPFVVERWSEGTWHTLMIGPDVGSLRRPVVLITGQSQEYSFRLNVLGRTRLLLTYWQGSKPDLVCTKPPKGARKAKSKPFELKLPATE